MVCFLAPIIHVYFTPPVFVKNNEQQIIIVLKLFNLLEQQPILMN